MFSKIPLTATIAVLYACSPVSAFFRMSCDVVQQGRIDPITDPGKASPHAHKIAGAANIGPDSTFETLTTAKCSSCSVQADKSAYWTPHLYFAHGNGTYQSVNAGGMAVYYLGRGTDRANIVPFPKGFRSLSGDNTARSYVDNVMTFNNKRPISDRVSFACLAQTPSKETPGMSRTDCVNGLRAQVHFPSCWNGKDLYLPDNSHTAYMSGIDGGDCPPTHPKLLPHIFFEVLYSVKDIDQSGGGKFVFSQGDTTGFGFHGDFINGWDNDVLVAAIKECINTNDGQVESCAAFKASIDKDHGKNCPLQPPVFPQEQVVGFLPQLPGGQMVGGVAPVDPVVPGTGAAGGDKTPDEDEAVPSGQPSGQPSGGNRLAASSVTATPTKKGEAKATSTSTSTSTSKSTKKDNKTKRALAHARDFAAPTPA
ncbi:MAG: hypothetical protein M1814_000624 [Vezdaea aestivalis]|nr:MAG: hypothetical protein M1814_000624 [Vezdaea aestivalis]